MYRDFFPDSNKYLKVFWYIFYKLKALKNAL